MADPVTELGGLIARRIALTGPISLADFMAEALGHPRLGYYRRAVPVGAAGDFTTAPEISQMFGELLGAWLAERWLAMGRPSPVRLVELGPGRGTLMADALRATRGVPGFHAAIDLHLVDTNAPMREAQRAALQAYRPTWHERFDEVPEGPLLLVANEFFDALPVRQFHRTAQGWRERMVGLDERGALHLALAPGNTPFASLLPAADQGAGEAPRPSSAKPDGRWRARSARASPVTAAGRSSSTTAWRAPAAPPRCRRCAATRVRASSTVPARPTSAPMSTSPRSPPRPASPLRARGPGRVPAPARPARTCAGTEAQCKARRRPMPSMRHRPA